MGEALEGLGLGGLSLLEGELDEDADLATHVDVGGKGAGLDLAGGEAGDLHVLAHDVNHLGELVGDGIAVHALGEEGVDVGRGGRGDDLGDVGGKAGELGVGAHEVGLAGELEEGTGLAVSGDERGDSALVGLAAGLLGGLGQAVLAEDVDGGIHIAIGLDEGLLALHHRGIGHLAELLDHSGGDLSHVNSFREEFERMEGRACYSALASAAASASGAAAISASETCSLPEPARQASAMSSHMRVTAEMASSLQGTP